MYVHTNNLADRELKMAGTGFGDSPMVTLISAGGHEYSISQAIARKSRFLRDVLDSNPDTDDAIPLSVVEDKDLVRVCWMHVCLLCVAPWFLKSCRYMYRAYVPCMFLFTATPFAKNQSVLSAKLCKRGWR